MTFPDIKGNLVEIRSQMGDTYIIGRYSGTVLHDKVIDIITRYKRFESLLVVESR